MGRALIGHVGLGVALIVWMGFGCAKLPVVIPPDPEPAPQRGWMFQESGAHLSDTGPVFYGVGQAAGLRNMSLLRATADNQAREEMAWVLRGFVATLAEAAGFHGTEEADQQPIHEITRTAMQHTRIVDHWYDPVNGIFKTLCRLELDRIKQILQSESQMDGALRQRMLFLADRVHLRMAGQDHP